MRELPLHYTDSVTIPNFVKLPIPYIQPYLSRVVIYFHESYRRMVL